jgi:hypothetical protein
MLEESSNIFVVTNVTSRADVCRLEVRARVNISKTLAYNSNVPNLR